MPRKSPYTLTLTADQQSELEAPEVKLVPNPEDSVAATIYTTLLVR